MVSKATVEMHPQEEVTGSEMAQPQAKEPDLVWVSLADREMDQAQEQVRAWGRAPDWDWELGQERAQVLELSLVQWPAQSEEVPQVPVAEQCQEPERVQSATEEEQSVP